VTRRATRTAVLYLVPATLLAPSADIGPAATTTSLTRVGSATELAASTTVPHPAHRRRSHRRPKEVTQIRGRGPLAPPPRPTQHGGALVSS